MKTIIINGQRELAELPELWYTDGTDEANEWGQSVMGSNYKWRYNYISSGEFAAARGDDRDWYYEVKGHTYITPSEFDRLVYKPWKEGQKVELPTTYKDLLDDLQLNGDKVYLTGGYSEALHINACIQLTNIMTFANDAFEKDVREWEIYEDGDAHTIIWEVTAHPIRFTSKAAAEWAYKTFPEIFKAYWNV
jgi:hypothetical protein